MLLQLFVSIRKRRISPVHQNAAQRALPALPAVFFCLSLILTSDKSAAYCWFSAMKIVVGLPRRAGKTGTRVQGDD